MLSAIYFKDEFLFKAHEIHDVRADRLLPAEFEAYKPAPAERVPQFALQIGLISS